MKSWLGLLVAASFVVPQIQPVQRAQFVDITRPAAIQFTHTNGASGKKYLPETLGAGAVFFDFDNDGFQDLLLINGKDWNSGKTTVKLYRNKRDRTFADVTAGSGIDVP